MGAGSVFPEQLDILGSSNGVIPRNNVASTHLHSNAGNISLSRPHGEQAKVKS